MVECPQKVQEAHSPGSSILAHPFTLCDLGQTVAPSLGPKVPL
jgi:hypothetical protein